METETVTFDTHGFVKRLTSAGMRELQAEILAEEQSRLNQERLATKQDLKQQDATLEQKLKELDIAHKYDIEKLRADLEQKLKEQEATIKAIEVGLRHDLEQQGTTIKVLELAIKALELAIKEQEAAIKAIEAGLKRDMMDLKRDLKKMEQKLTIKLGAFLGISTTILALLFALLTTRHRTCTPLPFPVNSAESTNTRG